MDKQKSTFTAKADDHTTVDKTQQQMQYNAFHEIKICIKTIRPGRVDAYFFPLICRKWWKTLMTSRIRRGASSILEARLIQAMATIYQDNQSKGW